MSWANEFDILEQEDGTPVQVYIKQSEYPEIKKGETYWAYIDEDLGGFNVVIEKFPMGLFFNADEVFHFKSRGNRLGRNE